MRLALLAGFLVSLAAGAASAQPAALPRSYALIVSGVSGDKAHYDKFWECASSLYKALRGKCGYSDEDIVFLFEEKSAASAAIDDVSTRANLAAAVEGLARRVREHDRLFVFVLGHADRRNDRVLLNLRGPDIDAEEFGRLFDRFAGRRVTFVIATPVSGYFVRHLSRPGRIVLTATDALPEISEPVFPYVFVRGFFDPNADANRDGFLSVLELFRYARNEVEGFYRQAELIQTEHPLLDDNGDGKGSRDPDSAGDGDGRLSSEEGFALQAGA